MGNLGLAYHFLGQVAQDRVLWQQVLAIFEGIHSPHAETMRRWLDDLDQP